MNWKRFFLGLVSAGLTEVAQSSKSRNTRRAARMTGFVLQGAIAASQSKQEGRELPSPVMLRPDEDSIPYS